MTNRTGRIVRQQPVCHAGSIREFPAVPFVVEAKSLIMAPAQCSSFDEGHLPGPIAVAGLVDAQSLVRSETQPCTTRRVETGNGGGACTRHRRGPAARDRLSVSEVRPTPSSGSLSIPA